MWRVGLVGGACWDGVQVLARRRSAEVGVRGAGPEGLAGIAGVGGRCGGRGCWSRWVGRQGWAG